MLQVAQSTEESELIPATRRRRPFRRAILATLIVIVVLCAAGGFIFWRATTASISFGFISGRVEAALRDRMPANAPVAVGSTAFSYRSGEGVILRIRDLSLDLPGAANVTASELAAKTTAAALFGGKIDIQSVTATGVSIGVTTPPKISHQGSSADMLRSASKMLMDQAQKADAIIRGLRALSDFEFEFNMALMNRHLEPELETIFVMPNEQFSYTSSTLVKQVAKFGGDVSHFVPKNVGAALRAAFAPERSEVTTPSGRAAKSPKGAG